MVGGPMKKDPESRSARLTLHFWALVFAWTVIVAALAVSDALHIDQTVREMAIAEARAHFNKDQAFRLWASSHGGVYVPVSDQVPPNPFLSHVPERDIQTPTGKSLTLMNPAYMIRQIMEQYTSVYGVYGHITGLKHFRPETAPDAWEATSLMAFEKGEKEALEFAEIHGKLHLRLMRPMVAEQDCLKCHGFQGYKVGDVRGGVSVSVPMDPYLDARREEIVAHGMSFGILWILGFFGIGFATYALKRRIRAADEAEQSLRISEKRYSTLVDSSLTGIYLIQDGKIKFANRKFAEIHEWKQEEMYGMDSLSLIHPEDRAFVAEIREKRLRGVECVSEYETRDLTKTGRTICVLRRNTLCTYDGKPAILGNLLDITERKGMEDRLRSSQIELRDLSSKLILAQEAERKRVADEIYDGIAQSLIALKYQMETSKAKMTEEAPANPGQLFDPLIAATQEMVDEIRGITAGLRPRIVDELGLIPAISSLCRDVRRLHHHIRLEEEITLQESDIQPSLRIAIYRIAEESLMNAIRHSSGTLVLVSLHKRENEIELTVEDNGVGFDISNIFTQNALRGGLGLAYMKERARLSGGALWVETDRKKGTTVRATWPVGQSVEI